jgi:hypothetical protein
VKIMKKHLVGMLLAATLALGCVKTPDLIVMPNLVFIVDNGQAIAWEGGLMWIAAMPIDPTVVDVNAVAASGARTIIASFSPSGCATATANANVIALQLNGCTGPFGLNSATGTVTFTFTTVQNGVQIAASAQSLQVGGGNLTIDATGVPTGSASSRALTVMTMGGGTGPGGSSVSRQGQYTITWRVGDTCASVNGTVATGTANSQSTSFQSLNACAQGCPRSGIVTLTDPATSTTTTSSYNGTSTVGIDVSNGQMATGVLTCG